MNTPLPEETLQRIKSAIFARRKIEAIKILRETANLGLAEAKEWVDNLTQELETKEPDKFTAKPKGCSTAVMALTVLILLTGIIRSWLT